MSEIVNCEAVTKIYPQGNLQVQAIRAVDFQVTTGEFISLSGPSGSGKTTLLNLIGGLDQVTAGKIIVAGQRVDQLNKAQLADLRLHKLGFIFQAYNLIPVLSAVENVEFIMQLQGLPTQERRARAAAILTEVGLGDLLHRRPSELSGGQQQRVAIARAVVSQPTLVLADEPTANLDSKTASDLLDLMARLNRIHQVTFIISTHDQRVIDKTQRRVYLQDGQIVADEPVVN